MPGVVKSEDAKHTRFDYMEMVAFGFFFFVLPRVRMPDSEPKSPNQENKLAQIHLKNTNQGIVQDPYYTPMWTQFLDNNIHTSPCPNPISLSLSLLALDRPRISSRRCSSLPLLLEEKASEEGEQTSPIEGYFGPFHSTFCGKLWYFPNKLARVKSLKCQIFFSFYLPNWTSYRIY